MLVVWIFICFATVSNEIHDPFLIIYTNDLFYVISAVGDLVLQLSIRIKQIQMSPAISLTPMNEFLSIICYAKPSHLHISIHPFVDQQSRSSGIHIHFTYINSFEIAARTVEIEFLVVTMPHQRTVVIVSCIHRLWSRPDTDHLVFEL